MKSRRTNSLSFNDIKQIIDFSASRGAKSVIFAGAGEPTLDPLLKKILNYIKKKKLKSVLFTNLSTIKSITQAKYYLENGPLIGKLFTMNEKKYNKITNCSTAFKNAQNALKIMLKARNELKVQGKNTVLAIDSYISKENAMDLPDLLRFCRKNEIIPYFEAFIELGQSIEVIKKYALSEKQLSLTLNKLKEIDKKEFGIKTKLVEGSRNYGQDICNKATHMFCVKENGDVAMCVCSLRNIGSIYEDKDVFKSLEEMFNIKNSKLLDHFKCDKCSKTYRRK